MPHNTPELKELTLRSIVLAIILTILLAISNAYLALKLGILISASIPAAIISMSVLRLFKNSNILENNAVQTAASAGEAIAGGIVYTIPALIIIKYWTHFDYITNFFIAAIGGILGVLFSIPLRKIIVHEPKLKFPEGVAIAQVLKSSQQKSLLKDIIMSGLIGGGIEILQTAFKLLASDWQYWFFIKRSLVGFSVGFSATMIGAGYLIGHEMAISIFCGAIISWLLAVPIISMFHFDSIAQYPADLAVIYLWNKEIRYLGIGAMLFAGIVTFIKLIKPLMRNLRLSLWSFSIKKSNVARTEIDIPFPLIMIGILIIAVIALLFFQFILPLQTLGFNVVINLPFAFITVLYILIIGFLFSVITAYFSGMIGVSASPGSSIVIAGMLLSAWLLFLVMQHIFLFPLTPQQLQAAEAITIIIGSVITGIAAIANDNTQDLKVGQLVCATPWKQQIMLLLGVIIASLVIPPVMQLLFDVYGIAGMLPHPNMDIAQTLPAPTAVLMATITEAVFHSTLPWSMMFFGAGIIMLVIIFNYFINSARIVKLSVLGLAIGMYLPLSSSFPLFFGGMISMFIQKIIYSRPPAERHLHQQQGVIIACGLVAGSTLTDVLLAIPFSLLHNPNALALIGVAWNNFSALLSVLMNVLLAVWIIKHVLSPTCIKKN